MTPVAQLVVHEGPLEPDAAERVMVERKVKKLPLVDGGGVLIGLITARDLRAPAAHAVRHARRRAAGCRVGAAIGATGDYLERAAELIRAGVDVLVIDIAHGHSVVMERATGAVQEEVSGRRADRRQCRDGGGRAVPEGPRRRRHQGRHRARAAAARRRMTTSFGVPQVQALVECRLAVGRIGRRRSSPTAASSGTARFSKRCCSAATA